MQNTPAQPTITYPYGIIQTLRTNVAWMGDPADWFEVRISAANDLESKPMWQSGEVKTRNCYITTPVLPASSTLYARIRIRNEAGWSEWSKVSEFRTPASPVIVITDPVNAGRVKGPSADIAWDVQTDAELTSQSLSLDDGESVDVPLGTESFHFEDISDGVHTVTIKARAGEKAAESSSTFYVYKTVQHEPDKLYTLDLSNLHQLNLDDPRETSAAFDTLHTIAVLQGIVNRKEPRLYINYMRVDNFWLDKIRAKGAYLEHAELVPLNSVEDAINAFKDSIKGVVVWDPEVPSTNNVASTICGVEDLLPVRYDKTPGSLYDRLVSNGPKLQVVHNLVGMFAGEGKIPGTDRDSTGSKKCDSYLWAKMHYLDTGKCNPAEIGYWCDAFWLKAPRDMSLDNVGLTNHDFVVARRGFFVDLDVWTDETPRDDPNQRLGLDRETLMEVLLSCYKANKGRMIHFSGFTPWAIKYTDHRDAGGKHGGVATEWETARIASSYNCYMDADAIGYVGMANASVYQRCALPDRLVQNRIPTRTDLEAKGYIDRDGNVAHLNFIYHYLGDYDSAAWMYNRMPDIWSNPERGRIPSGWAFNPNLIERMPPVFEWCYDTKTAQDYFVAGDSGAGYINPTELLSPREPSGLPSGADAWIEHNIPYFRKLDYSITGFLINGFCGELTDESNRMYTSFSSDGVMTQVWMPKDKKQDHLLDNMPVAHMEQDLAGSIKENIRDIVKYGRPGETAFRGFRCILKSPEWVKSINDGVRAAAPECRFEPVDPYTYFYLLRHTLGGKNEKRATFTFDTIPSAAKTGETLNIIIGVRNDGWDRWDKNGDDAVTLTIKVGEQQITEAKLPNDVGPGEGVVLSLPLSVPTAPGKYTIKIDMKRGKDGYFENAGNLPWISELVAK